MDNSNKRPLEDGCQYSHTETKKRIAAQVTTTTSHPKSSKEIIGFQDLSDDVLLYLFKYLSHDNLAKMALICPNLLRVSHNWSLWKKPRFEKFEKYMEDVYLSYLKEDTNELFISCNDVLSSDYSVTRTFLKKLATKCPELLHLTLTNQVLDAGEISVKILHRKLKTLTIDNTTIENIRNISSYLCGINKACPDLERIIMTNNDWISPRCFYELSNLKHLNYLSFAGCKQFNFGTLPRIIPITGFKCLQTLDLRFTPVSNVELLIFKRITLKNLLLESPEDKNDNRCARITDFGLEHFFVFYDYYGHGELELRRVNQRYGMETLYVRNYRKVTGEFLKFVARACPNLKLLDITGSCCTSENIRSFKSIRPSVKVICLKD